MKFSVVVAYIHRSLVAAK